MGGRIVRRKDLKPKPTPPPVDPEKLSPEARARRDAYKAAQAKRRAESEGRAKKEREDAAAYRAEAARKGLKIVNAGDAVSRTRNYGKKA